MTITELIGALTALREHHGDLPVAFREHDYADSEGEEWSGATREIAAVGRYSEGQGSGIVALLADEEQQFLLGRG